MDRTHKDWSSLQLGGRAQPRDIKVAIAYMRESICQQICMADIVAATGTPERTLRKHFLMFFGLAPLRFFRRLRLAAVRDALLATSSGNVTDISARFGIAHFGRFSRDYRRCFGELPSTTHRREVLPYQPGDLRSRRSVSAPSIAATMPLLVIVPFRTLGDRESNWFAEGLADLLAAELARGSALCIRLAPAASAAAIPRLGARYCLIGRVVPAIGRVRVIVRLIVIMHGHRHVDWIGECGGLLIVSAPSPVMEAIDCPETYFYVHTLTIGTDGRLRLLNPERIGVRGQQVADEAWT